MQKILSPLRRAVEDYDMIADGERIAVGVSGGKDSVTLLAALKRLSLFYPKHFEVIGITLDTGMDGMDFSPLKRFAKEADIELHVIKTNIKQVVFDIRKESNPCSLCAMLRRGALHDAVKELGVNKLALGHHYDDVSETFMLNLIYEGRIGCFRPVTYLDRKEITVIRPLIYATEKEVRSCVARNSLPVVHNPCPANGKTEREGMKCLLQDLEDRYPGVNKRIFGALQRSGIDGWQESVRGRKKK